MGAELRVLGSLEVVDGDSVDALPGRKHSRLLAALAIANGGRAVRQARKRAHKAELRRRDA